MTMDQPANSTSHVSIPAETWVHTRETITLLYLAICQIETSIQESNESVQQLTNTFTHLANQTLDGKIQHDDKGNPIWSTDDMRERINEAITAFQFYDRISQRLDHVSKGLERMTNVFGDIKRIEDPNCWKQIKDEVRASYSMESERAMFEKIVGGASVQEALAAYNEIIAKEQKKKDDHDSVELF